MLHGQAVPAAIEVEWPTDGNGAVHVLLEGREDGVERPRARPCAPCSGARRPRRRTTRPGGRRTPGTPRPPATTGTCLKLTFVLSGLADVLATAHARRGCTCAARPAPGSLYAALAAGTRRRRATAVRSMRETCTRVGGSAVVVDAPAAVKAAVDVWGPVPALDLMRRVKDQFDPDHRLAPGRFVGDGL